MVMMLRMILSRTVAVALCVALTSCGGTHEPTGPGYTPLSDKVLFTQIAAIPGVTKVDIEYVDTFENSNGYIGTVDVRTDEDAVGALDQALAILRQGRWRAGMQVVVLQGGRQISTSALGLNAPTDRRLTERYGPQPGNGLPPESPPSP